MKKFFILFTAAGFFITSCNNNNDSFVTSDSASDSNAVATTHGDAMHSAATPVGQDTAGMARGLMPGMSSMMAGMKSMQMTGDFDADYANAMIMHHQGALDMAQVAVSEGQDAKIKSMAQQIISKQKTEQDNLKTFLQNYKPSGMKHGEGALQKSMDAMAAKMMKMPMSSITDQDFATMMIAHHEHGIAMDKLEVEHGMDNPLKAMAKKSIASQQNEIKALKAWLATAK